MQVIYIFGTTFILIIFFYRSNQGLTSVAYMKNVIVYKLKQK